jgi:NTF2 fold immunity protein
VRITIIFVLLLAALTPAANAQKGHTDYVPDQKTAARVAQAILSAKFGEERVNALLPLTVDGSNKDYWIVQGNSHETTIPSKGGGPAVWINKHSGCIVNVTDHMK